MPHPAVPTPKCKCGSLSRHCCRPEIRDSVVMDICRIDGMREPVTHQSQSGTCRGCPGSNDHPSDGARQYRDSDHHAAQADDVRGNTDHELGVCRARVGSRSWHIRHQRCQTSRKRADGLFLTVLHIYGRAMANDNAYPSRVSRLVGCAARPLQAGRGKTRGHRGTNVPPHVRSVGHDGTITRAGRPAARHSVTKPSKLSSLSPRAGSSSNTRRVTWLIPATTSK
jgi:hypothetical protein